MGGDVGVASARAGPGLGLSARQVSRSDLHCYSMRHALLAALIMGHDSIMAVSVIQPAASIVGPSPQIEAQR